MDAELAPGKCAGWSPAGAPAPPGWMARWCTDGVVQFSVPLGTDAFMSAAVDQLVVDQRGLTAAITALPAAELQSQLLLLRLCAGPQPSYWLRALPLVWGARLPGAVDRAAQAALRQLLCDIRDDSVAVDALLARAALPLAHGGLGIGGRAAVVPAAALASQVDTLRAGRRYTPVMAAIADWLLGAAHTAPTASLPLLGMGDVGEAGRHSRDHLAVTAAVATPSRRGAAPAAAVAGASHRGVTTDADTVRSAAVTGPVADGPRPLIGAGGRIPVAGVLPAAIGVAPAAVGEFPSACRPLASASVAALSLNGAGRLAHAAAGDAGPAVVVFPSTCGVGDGVGVPLGGSPAQPSSAPRSSPRLDGAAGAPKPHSNLATRSSETAVPALGEGGGGISAPSPAPAGGDLVARVLLPRATPTAPSHPPPSPHPPSAGTDHGAAADAPPPAPTALLPPCAAAATAAADRLPQLGFSAAAADLLLRGAAAPPLRLVGAVGLSSAQDVLPAAAGAAGELSRGRPPPAVRLLAPTPDKGAGGLPRARFPAVHGTGALMPAGARVGAASVATPPSTPAIVAPVAAELAPLRSPAARRHALPAAPPLPAAASTVAPRGDRRGDVARPSVAAQVRAVAVFATTADLIGCAARMPTRNVAVLARTTAPALRPAAPRPDGARAVGIGVSVKAIDPALGRRYLRRSQQTPASA